MMNSAHSCKTILADSHNHIHFKAFSRDLDGVMVRAHDQGIRLMLAVGIDKRDSLEALRVARTYQGVYASIGIHPQNAGKASFRDVIGLADIHEPGRVVAVGETGFDLYRTPDTRSEQKDLFRSHIELARKLNLPLVIHDRNAHEETVAVLDETDGWSLGGVFHCFSGDTALAQYVVSKGFLVSVPGVVTFKNSLVLRQVVSQTPETCLLVETDAPYLSPEPFRGKRNEPAYIRHTVEEVARIKERTFDEIVEITSENFRRLFLHREKSDIFQDQNREENICSND
ncbi:MAG: TatD family hydrolase [Desulfomonilia bacterium]